MKSTSERLGRRGFLGALAAALVFDPERALWRPGEKLISIPKPPRYYSHGGMSLFQAFDHNANILDYFIRFPQDELGGFLPEERVRPMMGKLVEAHDTHGWLIATPRSA